MVITSSRSPVDAVIKNVYHQQRVWRTRNSPTEGLFFGANALIDPNDTQAVEALLALPNYWPGEDAAMKDVILNQGGAVRKAVDLRTGIIRRDERAVGIVQRFLLGGDGARAEALKKYAADAPPGATPYQ